MLVSARPKKANPPLRDPRDRQSGSLGFSRDFVSAFYQKTFDDASMYPRIGIEHSALFVLP